MGSGFLRFLFHEYTTFGGDFKDEMEKKSDFSLFIPLSGHFST